MDCDIRLSPKAIRLTDERDAPAAKRSGWVRTKPELRNSRKAPREELSQSESRKSPSGLGDELCRSARRR